MRLDHLAVSATDLAEGAEFVAAALGAVPGQGGKHPLMGTHNRLLGMGDIYLEVIAPDPGAEAPKYRRWFDLDNFQAVPTLTNWVVSCENIKHEIAAGPPGIGGPMVLERGDLRWTMAVPPSGRLPFDDAFPALIEWHGTAHPVQHLPDSGLRLIRLEVAHPDACALRAALLRLTDPRVVIVPGPAKVLRATFDTPHGRREL